MVYEIIPIYDWVSCFHPEQVTLFIFAPAPETTGDSGVPFLLDTLTLTFFSPKREFRAWVSRSSNQPTNQPTNWEVNQPLNGFEAKITQSETLWLQLPLPWLRGFRNDFQKSAQIDLLNTTPRKTNECPVKRDYFNRKYIFQPSFFRGYVSFQGCMYYYIQWFLVNAPITGWYNPIP